MSNYGVCLVCHKPAEGDGGLDILYDEEQKGYVHFTCTFGVDERKAILKGGPYDGQEHTVAAPLLALEDVGPDGEPMGLVKYSDTGKKDKNGREIFKVTQRWINPDGQ